MIMIYTDDSNAQVMQEYQILSDHSLHPNIPVLFGAFRSLFTPTMIVKMWSAYLTIALPIMAIMVMINVLATALSVMKYGNGGHDYNDDVDD